jgi:hypothetical protein
MVCPGHAGRVQPAPCVTPTRLPSPPPPLPRGGGGISLAACARERVRCRPQPSRILCAVFAHAILLGIRFGEGERGLASACIASSCTSCSFVPLPGPAPILPVSSSGACVPAATPPTMHPQVAAAAAARALSGPPHISCPYGRRLRRGQPAVSRPSMCHPPCTTTLKPRPIPKSSTPHKPKSNWLLRKQGRVFALLAWGRFNTCNILSYAQDNAWAATATGLGLRPIDTPPPGRLRTYRAPQRGLVSRNR